MCRWDCDCGAATEVIREALLRVERWGGCRKHPLYVGNMGYDFVFGYDFLMPVGALWGFGSRPIQFPVNVESKGLNRPSWLLRLLSTG